MRVALVAFSMLMSLLWLGYTAFLIVDIVPADSVGAGSPDHIVPGLVMYVVSLVSTLLPSGLFSRRQFVVAGGILLAAAVVVLLSICINRWPTCVQLCLHAGTVLLVVLGTTVSYAWRWPNGTVAIPQTEPPVR